MNAIFFNAKAKRRRVKALFISCVFHKLNVWQIATKDITDTFFVRTLTENEMLQFERLARSAEIAKMLSFFEQLPCEILIPHPLLLGSKNASEMLVNGFTTRTSVIKIIRSLNQPFNPNL